MGQEKKFALRTGLWRSPRSVISFNIEILIEIENT